MQKTDFEYLRFIEFKNIVQWDLKRYFKLRFTSKYQIKYLDSLIKEEKNRYDISNPKENYKILGVNNQTGIFDAYVESGAKINQKYKRMEDSWIAYNPYRVNVGSIGIKRKEHNNEYISPAYVVFSCKENLFAEYLFLTMKTPFFNKIIKDSTTGSVRQNLSCETLRKLQIPLPFIEEQKRLVAEYNTKIQKADELELQAKYIEKDIEKYLLDELGIKEETKTEQTDSYLKFVRFKEIDRWDCYNKIKMYSDICKYDIYTMAKLVIEKPQYGAPYKAVNDVSDVRYIRITDINDDGTLNGDIVYPDNYDDKYLLQQDDFLIARSGTVGKTFLYDKSYGKAIFAGYLIKFVINKQILNPHYLLYYTKSHYYKKWIESNMRVAGQPNINSQQYLDSPIICPPIDVQNKIVTHITELKEQIKQMKLQAECLRKTALEDFEHKIFE